jgi:hypothetical protein
LRRLGHHRMVGQLKPVVKRTTRAG